MSLDINKIKSMMAEDAVIDESGLASEAIKTMALYNKYQNLFYRVTEEIITLTAQVNKKKLFLYEYYLGKCPDEVYKEKPKHNKVLKGDVDMYIKADDEYIALDTKLRNLELLAKHIDDYMKQLSSRNYAIKNAIDYIKFQNGGY